MTIAGQEYGASLGMVISVLAPRPCSQQRHRPGLLSLCLKSHRDFSKIVQGHQRGERRLDHGDRGAEASLENAPVLEAVRQQQLKDRGHIQAVIDQRMTAHLAIGVGLCPELQRLFHPSPSIGELRGSANRLDMEL